MKIIGITGGIGAGKSEIIHLIQDNYSTRVIFSDEVAKALQKKGQVCYEQIVSLLGSDILQADGEIDKARMAQHIFSSTALLAKVNAIIHPAVKDYILQAIEEEKTAKKIDFLLIEAALLIEEGYKSVVDELWYIYAKEEIRRERLQKSRGYSEEKIDSILKTQLSDEIFRKECDFVIDNSASLMEAKKQIDKRLEGYLCQK